MTIITTILRQVHRLWAMLAKRSGGALRARIEAIRWRRRILRSLDQRRRG